MKIFRETGWKPYIRRISYNGLNTPLVSYAYYKMRSDIHTKQKELCDEYKIVIRRLDDSFPKYQNLKIKSKHGNKKPIQKNNSHIYITPDNNYSISTYESEYVLEGSVSSDVEKIEVIWSGDNKSYFIPDYTSDLKTFKYRINKKLGNINNGENKYLIRGYAENYIYEKVFFLEYFSPDVINTLRKTDKLIETYVNSTYSAKDGEYFLNDSNLDFTHYILGLGFGSTEFLVNGYRIIFYNDPKEPYGENNKSFIQIFDENDIKLAELNGTYFYNDGWYSSELTSYNNGYLEFNGFGQYFYNYKTKDFIDIRKFVSDNFEDYGGNLFVKLISDDTLSIQAFLALHQEEGTNYSFELDLNTMKINNIKADVEELLYEDYFFKD